MYFFFIVKILNYRVSINCGRLRDQWLCHVRVKVPRAHVIIVHLF